LQKENAMHGASFALTLTSPRKRLQDSHLGADVLSHRGLEYYTETRMAPGSEAHKYRFGVFEANAETGELRRQGTRVKINGQPFQILLMLLENRGELVSREEIQKALWPDGTFVDFDHGLNSAINRIREALGDSAANPRYVETLARRGYRFLAPVESTRPSPEPAAATAEPLKETPEAPTTILASPAELPKASHELVRWLFLLMQLMYLGFYVGALANLREIEELFSSLRPHSGALSLLIVTAAILIPMRLFLLSSLGFRAPGVRQKYLRLFPLLMFLDELWALSPFLLLHHIDIGVALAATAALVYSPFAQRSLILMGAGEQS
jgi:cholera toxin transcriptional activator